MTFHIVADSTQDNAWLDYTLDLITEVLCLAAPIRRIRPEDFSADMPALFYGVNPPSPGALFLPRLDATEPSSLRRVRIQCGRECLEEVLIYEAAMETSGRVDLLRAVFLYVSLREEWLHEARKGPIHSYSLALPTDPARFDRPFANLLILAFKEMVKSSFPNALPSEERQPAIYLSHDVDAIQKAPINRCKESAFRFINAGRHIFQGRLTTGLHCGLSGLRMLCSKSDWFGLEAIAEMEYRHDLRSTFNIFAGLRPVPLARHVISRIFDPAYDPRACTNLVAVLRKIAADMHEIGMHFGFDSWRNACCMTREKHVLETLLMTGPIVSSRQHWLRFSLSDTWHDLWASGIQVDTTLGFNDRPGFRAGLAVSFHPYDHASGRAHPIKVVPMALMDTHLFHYSNFDVVRRRQVIERLLAEVKYVHGEAGIIWHTHVFSSDHKWDLEYHHLLDLMNKLGLHARLPNQIASGERLCTPLD